MMLVGRMKPQLRKVRDWVAGQPKARNSQLLREYTRHGRKFFEWYENPF